WPLAFSSLATLAGSATKASALASRRVGCLSPTSTMVGRLAASRWVSPDRRTAIRLPANVVHLHLRAGSAGAQHHALLAVAILAIEPGAAYQPQHLLVVGAAAQRATQVDTVLGEQAGVEDAIGGQPRARTATAERLGDR